MAATPTWWCGPASWRRRPRRSAPCAACTSSSTPAWAGSARRTRTWRGASRTLPSSDGSSWRACMTHFATADEPRRRPTSRSSSSASATFADELRAAHPGHVVHAANSAATFRDPAAHFDMVRCGVAIYGLDPFQGDPARARARACAGARVLGGRGQALRAGRRARATGAAGARRGPTWVATVPIGYGDGWRRGLTNDADVLIARPPLPAGGHGEHGQHHGRRSGPDTDVEVGDTVVLIGAPGRTSGSSPRRWRRGSARSTTRSPAGSPRGCAGCTRGERPR